MFTFDANAQSRPKVRFTVTAPSGCTGDNPNNNSATVQVSGGRRSSG
jgi:hypothetical protein